MPRSRLSRTLSPPAWCVSLALLLALVACETQDVERPGRGPIAVRDSIRARRNASLALRPDTMGARVDSQRIIGSPDAAAVLVVVSDFQCTECRRFAREVLPHVRSEFVAPGTARLAFVNFPQDNHFNARFAALSALCAGAAADRFWAMHDTLFASQPAWARRDDPRPFFDSLAVAVGADTAAYRGCVERQRMLNLLAGDIERSMAAGVPGVPTVLVGETRLSGSRLTIPEIRRALREGGAPR
jgi:protein-disulfide isomerase